MFDYFKSVFGVYPVGRALQMLGWLTFWILQAFLTCKDHFMSSVFDVWPVGRYLRYFVYANTVYVSVWSEWLKYVYIRSILLAKILFMLVCSQCMIILMCASAGLTSWMTLEFHFFVKLEVSYIFHTVHTSLLPLADVQNFYLIYILVGFNHIF